MSYRVLVDEQPPGTHTFSHVRRGETVVLTSTHTLNTLYGRSNGKWAGPYIRSSEEFERRHRSTFEEREAMLAELTGAKPQSWQGLEALLARASEKGINVLAVGAGIESLRSHAAAAVRRGDHYRSWAQALRTGSRVSPYELEGVRERLGARLMREAARNLHLHEQYYPGNSFVFCAQPYEASSLRRALPEPAFTTQYLHP